MTPQPWQPIGDLPADATAMASPSLGTLRVAWAQRKHALEASPALRTFRERQVRQWSVQTGILERLYTLDDAVTSTLVELGFDAAYVPHGASDVPAERLIRILEAHREAAEGLFAFVKRDRVLSTSYIKELHAVLCRHQDTATGVDALGRLVETALVKGAYKRQPNDPRDARTGEVVFHYCPPDHVDEQMERLVAWHQAHAGVPSEVESAWLHHRFVQIHPFQDGSGRVARALATLVCIRDGGFPVVVMAADKPRYIAALRAADRGDLQPFVDLVADQQQGALLQALSIGEQALEQPVPLGDLLADARRRLERRAQRRPRLPVHDRAGRLAEATEKALAEVAGQVGRSMAGVSPAVTAKIETQRFDRMSFGHGDIGAIAERLKYQADAHAEHWWSELRIDEQGAVTTRLVVSLHHVGPREQGLMAAAAFLARVDLRAVAAQVSATPLADKPLTFTAEEDEADLVARFTAWLHDAIRVGLLAWRKGL